MTNEELDMLERSAIAVKEHRDNLGNLYDLIDADVVIGFIAAARENAALRERVKALEAEVEYYGNK